ncbi:MAG: hypothetical protein IJM79_04235 [Erysipelotrichaceae bacterium]|nr:hypothetical protein [Erysipelotrichaceae bacterium]
MVNKKNTILHSNYTKNMDRFNAAMENDSQIEALMILYSVFEQVTSNLVVRLASLSDESHEFFTSEIGNSRIVSLRQKIRMLKKHIRNNKQTVGVIFKGNEGIDELLSSLEHINQYHDQRNVIAHHLMLSDVDYDELRDINNNLKLEFRILDKNLKRVKSYIEKNGVHADVSDLPSRLE